MDIDFTLLQKKGLLKVQKEVNDVIDFTKNSPSTVPENPIQQPTTPSMFDLFDKPQEKQSYYPEPSTDGLSDLGAISTKLEALESKINDIELLLRRALRL